MWIFGKQGILWPFRHVSNMLYMLYIVLRLLLLVVLVVEVAVVVVITIFAEIRPISHLDNPGHNHPDYMNMASLNYLHIYIQCQRKPIRLRFA